ncbi:MAG: sensor signal transduction histidine kinase [Myxococcales bacterium]|nr:sensor signal transduction histidine kinase [Myxococcales bacterium]
MTLAAPSSEAQLAALRDLAAELPIASSERALVDRSLDIFSNLLPGRGLCVRVVDVRTREPARTYVRGAPLRDGIEHDPVTINEAALTRAHVKSAVAASARLNLRDRWDSPFTGMATGFAMPLAAGGEMYGILDVGYAPGTDARITDESTLIPLANHLAVALRIVKLQDDALGLRDYQARLLESANALILGIDRSWRITVCNRAMLDLTGFNRDEVLGRDVRDFISSDQRQYLTSAFAAALVGQHHAAVTVALPTRSQGQVRTVWSIAPVGRAGAPGGSIEAVVAIGQDQSKIEALQQQVVRAERLATLGELAAGVVHELNNPLTSITVYAEYLVRKLEAQGSEASDLEKLRRIGGSAQRILRFSRDLVQYARPSGRDLEPVDLAGVVRQSVSICEHLVERGGIDLSIDVDPELPMIHAVQGQLEQVLINLITNAVHAVESGGKVSVRAQIEGPASVLIEVADSGPGVPEEDRQRIFEPFFTTKPDGKGTGLGLPIVRNIVDQHRGEISVTRSDLGGASFRVVLPIA